MAADLSQSSDRDDTNDESTEESNPDLCQSINQCSEEIIPGRVDSLELSAAAIQVQSLKSCNCTSEVFSQRLKNLASKEVEEGIATISKNIQNPKFKQGITHRFKEGLNLETIQELDQESDWKAVEDIRQSKRTSMTHGPMDGVSQETTEK